MPPRRDRRRSREEDPLRVVDVVASERFASTKMQDVAHPALVCRRASRVDLAWLDVDAYHLTRRHEAGEVESDRADTAATVADAAATVKDPHTAAKMGVKKPAKLEADRLANSR